MAECSVRDRTREFMLTMQAVRERTGSASVVKETPVATRKRFSQKAGQIGKDIHRSAEKLAKLTKREHVFPPPSAKNPTPPARPPRVVAPEPDPSLSAQP